MKTSCIVILTLVFAACATPPTLEELEFQALQTGDWSAVDRRERALSRRTKDHGLDCPKGLTTYCSEVLGRQQCSCVSRETVESLFGWN
jgi:hypothetical protein